MVYLRKSCNHENHDHRRSILLRAPCISGQEKFIFVNLIFLIGMPGVGKTFWGRTWAAQHGWSFIDLDEQIETLANVSIPEIFASAGEEGFRAIESHVLGESIRGAGRVNTIIATGGGTPCEADNLALMKASGCVVLLKARPQILLRQLRASRQPRPLLQALSLEELEALEAKRSESYAAAHLQLEAGKIHKGTFAQILEACSNLPS